MKKLLSLFAFSFLALAIALPSSVFAATPHSWVESQPNGDVDRVWTTGSSDADGSFLIVGTMPLGSGNGRMYTSDDGGLLWMERQPAGDISKFWRTSDINSDGSLLIIGSAERLYTSTNGGVNWTERQPAGDANIQWDSVASDADGSNLIVGSGGERLYTSVDSGANWTERQPAGDVNGFWVVDSDADGSALIAGNEGGRLYTSTNGGVNWTERQPAGNANKNWNSVASDSDGSNLIVAVSGGRLYTSTNGGVNWTERQPDGDMDHSWNFVSSDATGQNLFAQKGGQIYSSDDGGVTWVEEQPAGNVAQSWNFIVSDSDGTNVIVGAANDRIYTAPDVLGPLVTTFSPTDDAVEVAINGTFNVTFNEDIATSTGDITLHLASDDSLVETIDIAGPKVTLSDTDTLTIDPTVTLDLATEYYFLIGAGVVEDLFGNAFAGISDSTMWSFTTDTLPAVSSFTPEDNATDVSLGVLPSEGVYIQFDQNVVVGTGNITLKKASDDSTALTFDVTDDNYVYTSGSDLYLYSEDSLEYATEYYLLIDATAIEDENGNAFAGISDPTAWSFTTRSTPLPPTFDFELVSFDEGNERFEDGVNNNFIAMSDDGRYVAFSDTTYRLYVRDMEEDTTVAVAEIDANGSGIVVMSGDGRYTVFGVVDDSAPGDSNGLEDTYLYDRIEDSLEVISENEGGVGGSGSLQNADISDDGRYVVFFTNSRLVPSVGEGNNLYLRDRQEGSTILVQHGGGSSVALNSDGNLILFQAYESLDEMDDNESYDAYVYNVLEDSFELVSILTEETTALGNVTPLDISSSGRYVLFKENTDEGTELIYLRDRETYETFEIVEGSFFGGSVSNDGRYIVFGGEPLGEESHIYRYDRQEDIFLPITEGGDSGGSSVQNGAPRASSDSSSISFVSDAINFVDGDENGNADVFLWDESLQEVDEETPAEEEEDNGGRNASHRRSGGGSSSSGDAALLESLLVRVQELKAILASLLGTPSTTSSDYTRDLDIGDVGDDIRALQNFLIAQNKGPQAQALASNGATGFFGPLTQAALAEYQASVGITPAVGFFGPVTRAFVNSL